MLLQLFKCQQCDHRFEAKVLDNSEPEERHRPGSPLRCPKCGFSLLDLLRTIAHRVRRAS